VPRNPTPALAEPFRDLSNCPLVFLILPVTIPFAIFPRMLVLEVGL
jgi:hypothetical protein